MRQSPRRLRSLIVVAAIVAVVAGAAESARAEKRAINGSLAGQLRMIQSRIVSGRFSAVCPASNQSMTSNVNVPDRREKLSINLAGGKPTVFYEASTSREKFALSIEQGDSITLRLDPTNESEGTSVYFSQGAAGPVSLTIRSGKETREIYAQSVWQLMLVEPEACREHLLPMMQLIRPGWQLKQQADTIEDLLCRSANGQTAAERAAWQKAVTNLGSARYAERERAEQHLLEAGQRVLPLLQSLPRTQLDAEQAFRVRRIVRQLTGDGEEDTPDRVAFWLAEDPRVWYAIAGREDVAKRRAAAPRLIRLLPAPGEFHPEGSAEDREIELRRLREANGETLNSPTPDKTTNIEPRQETSPTKGSGSVIGFTFRTF